MNNLNEQLTVSIELSWKERKNNQVLFLDIRSDVLTDRALLP